MEEQVCNHIELEKINNLLFVCKNCSIIGLINEVTETETKIKLLSKPSSYNIKNEINIYDITKNTINFYMNDEKVKKPILNLELYLKYRKKMVKHIFNLCMEINSTYECYYLSILLMDNVVNNLDYVINNYQLDLISTSCFIISKKFIEKDNLKKQNYSSFLTICYSPQKFIKSIDLIIAEIECLKIVKYNLNIPTSYTILNYMMICGYIFNNEIEKNKINKIYDECLKILNFCVEQNEIYIDYDPVQTVFGIIYLVRKRYNLESNIIKYMNDLFNVKFCSIKECTKLISKLYFENNNNNVDKVGYFEKGNGIDVNITKLNKVKYLSQRKKAKTKFKYFSPIIKNRRNYKSIKNTEVGSINRLSSLNLEKIDKNNDIDNSIIIIKNDCHKNFENLNKIHFFRCNQKKRKNEITDLKNSSSHNNTNNQLDLNLYIEKEKN